MAGPDGNLWFGEAVDNQVGRVTPGGRDHRVSHSEPAASVIGTSPPAPTAISGSLRRMSRRLRAGDRPHHARGCDRDLQHHRREPETSRRARDGNVWFSVPDDQQDLPHHAHRCRHVLRRPDGGSAPTGVTKGPDGNVWFTEAQTIGRVTPDGNAHRIPRHRRGRASRRTSSPVPTAISGSPKAPRAPRSGA